MNKYEEALNAILAFRVCSGEYNRKLQENNQQAPTLLKELVEKTIPIKPVILGSHEGIEFKDGRKSPDLYVGRCECGKVVYNNWKCCPYCAKALEWETK